MSHSLFQLQYNPAELLSWVLTHIEPYDDLELLSIKWVFDYATDDSPYCIVETTDQELVVGFLEIVMVDDGYFFVPGPDAQPVLHREAMELRDQQAKVEIEFEADLDLERTYH